MPFAFCKPNVLGGKSIKNIHEANYILNFELLKKSNTELIIIDIKIIIPDERPLLKANHVHILYFNPL